MVGVGRRCGTVVAASMLVILLAGPTTAAPDVQADPDLTVTSASDRANGDIATVAGLIASPGPDGISLREAIEATNRDPGRRTVAFAPALRGKTITLSFDLPPLTGGGVTLLGAGVTLRTGVKAAGSPCGRCALQLASSGNRLQGLGLQGFDTGVVIGPYRKLPAGALPVRTRLADNVVTGLVVRAGTFGIVLRSVWSPTCGVPRPRPCRSLTLWSNTTITDNAIESGASGIAAKLYNSGDRVARLTVTGNKVRILGSTDSGIGLNAGGDSVQSRLSDVLIARNSIEGRAGIGIDVAAGVQRAQAGIVERVRVLDNRVHLVRRGPSFCCQGIAVQAGSDTPEAMFPDVKPVRYPDGNVTRNVEVRGNTVTGTLVTGVSVQAGIGSGGSRNRVENVRVERNTIRSDNPLAPGVFLWTSQGEPFQNRYATGNRVTGVSIAQNGITIGTTGTPSGLGADTAGGIVLVGGGSYGRNGLVRDVRIAGNRIAARGGIKLIGGMGGTARGNSVSCVRISGTSAPVSVRPSVGGGPGNRATLAC